MWLVYGLLQNWVKINTRGWAEEAKGGRKEGRKELDGCFMKLVLGAELQIPWKCWYH